MTVPSKTLLFMTISLFLVGMSCSLPGLADDNVAHMEDGESVTNGPDGSDVITTPGSVFLPLVATPTGAGSLQLGEVNDFLYQLQNLDLQAIGQTAYDLVIMDYSSDGSAERTFLAAEIEDLKHSPGGEKIVLAYMSIGEAENYRFYWQDDWDANTDGTPDPGAPAWLDVQNPEWQGNYKVHYWDPGWQSLILAYTDRLLDAGFDGAYLDIIDAYEYYAEQGRSSAPAEMRDFIAAIRAQAHQRDPEFLIVPQNAAELVGLLPDYLQFIDGLGQEDLYYGYDGDDLPTPAQVTANLEQYLDLYVQAGKIVLTTDYAWTQAHIEDAYSQARRRGYHPFVTFRDLDQLIIHPSQPPD